MYMRNYQSSQTMALENFEDLNSISFCVNEIQSCLKNECYLAALSLALALPDVFAKIEYGKTSRSSYEQWFNHHVRNYFGLLYSDEFYTKGDQICFSGEACYQLRCALFHEASDHIKAKTGIDEFVLVMNKEPFARGNVAGTEMCLNGENTGVKTVTAKNYLYISVTELCNGIIDAVIDYTQAHPEVLSKFPTIRMNRGGGKVNKSFFTF